MSTTHRRNIALPPAKSATATAPAPTLPVASSTVDTISNHFAKLRTNHKLFTSSKGQNGYSKSHVETHSQAKPMVVSPIAEASNKSFAQSTLQHRRNTSEMNRGSSRTTGIGRVEKKLNESHEKNHLVKAISSSNTDGIKKVPMKESEFKKETHEDCDIKEEILSSKSDKLKNLHKNESRGGHDMKRASDFLSRSLDSGLRLKNFSEGCELKRPSFSLAEGGGRRRSFYRSQAEMSDFFSCNGVKIVAVDMPPFMQIHAVDCARKTHDSLEKFTSKALALNLKKEFDGGYGPAWHCIVGTSFGSFVTHSVGGFMYFSMDHKLYILLFKTTVQRAD